jgi:NAD-dependent dihydropyrimidine dehydrogenase PreA subunit
LAYRPIIVPRKGPQAMSLLDDFVRIFQMPPAMIPHIDFVVQGREMELVVTLGDTPKTSEQISETLRLSAGETDALLQSAFTRYVVNRKTDDGVTTYTPGTFYRRLDPMSMYENWGDVPADARDAVIDWQLEEFIAIWQPIIEDIRRDPDAHVRIPNRDVLLLDEALEMVEAASLHVVVPCDCRAIVMACKRPSEACIRLDKGAESTLERGHGRQLTKDEMKALVIDCHRAGLMHTGRRAWREYGELYGFCNCCACDCYPFRGGIKLDMHRQWPRAHYVAEREMSKCEQCGKCVQRCHFGAFYRDTVKVEVNGKQRYRVLFDASKCYGCGLCATTCPDEAITMRPLTVGLAPAAIPG